MSFKKFNKSIQNQFDKMCKTGKLFRVNVTGNEIWDVYLSSFSNEGVFRDPESSEHNCNCCKNFVRRYGNLVAINELGQIESIFSDLGDVGEYSEPSSACSTLIEDAKIKDVFFETYKELNENLNYESCRPNQQSFKLGVASNFKEYNQEEADKFGVVTVGKVYEFEHFCLDLPERFVDKSGKSIEQIMALYRDKYSVFKRTMEEISLDTLRLVRDLINQGSLLDGTAHLHAIESVMPFKSVNIDSGSLDLFCWDNTYLMDERIAKFKNTLIGVLCTELSEGMELNKACTNWNKRVDPVNYHKASAPITQRQIKEAQKFVKENGYEESFNRRLATIEDIKSSEILHLNSGDGKIKEVSVFDNVKATPTRHKRAEFDNVQEISIEKFMSDILPTCSSIEAYLKNDHQGNMVALTTSLAENPKRMFKWDNPYSFTFNGNLAGKSQIKEAVKTAGGSVSGVLRFSIMWADGDGDNSDLDAHCVEPDSNLISFSRKHSHHTDGRLDIDITQPNGNLAVENITYPSVSKMSDGSYEFLVHQYAARQSKGFKAEIEFDGEIYSYSYDNSVSGKIRVANVRLEDGKFNIEHKLPETNSSKELWNLETNNFHKVNLACLSPNHWGNNEVGNKHYMFMLEGCSIDTSMRGFHNENLLPELLKHRKVMEVLGATNMIEPTEKHLAGIGFNSTVRDELMVKCKGSHNRMLKIKF